MNTGGEGRPLKPYRRILEQEIEDAVEELRRPAHGLVLSGVIAGLGISASTFLVAMLLTLDDGALPRPFFAYLIATAYSLGFIIVILARTDVFTEYTTIAILPVLTGDAAFRRLARLWTLVLGANLVGCAAAAALITFLGAGLAVATADSYVYWGGRLLDVGAAPMLLSAALAGWLMGLLSWLVTAARDTISQIVFVWAIGFIIGFAHLHHIVTGSVDVLAALFAGGAIGAGDLARFFTLTAAGNILGGTAFALLIRSSLVTRRTHAH